MLRPLLLQVQPEPEAGAGVLPLDFICACPPGYEPDAATVERARAAGKSSITITHDPMQHAKGADIIYTGECSQQRAERARIAARSAWSDSAP